MRTGSKLYVLLALALSLLHLATSKTTEPNGWEEELQSTNHETTNFTGMEETNAYGNYSWRNIDDRSSSDFEDNSKKPLSTQHVNATFVNVQDTTSPVHLPTVFTWWNLTDHSGEDDTQHVNATFANVQETTFPVHLPTVFTWRNLTDHSGEDDTQYVNATDLQITEVSAQEVTPTVHLWEDSISNSTATTWGKITDHPGEDNVTETSIQDFDQPSTLSSELHQPLIYRNYGHANDTGSGWRITVYDADDVPCLKMNLQVLINVYFVQNNPRSRPSFIQTLPTSPDELHVEGECNNGSSLVFLSCESANLTLRFDGGENGTWSLVEVELSVANREWFEKYQICESPCDPIGLRTSPEDTWAYNSRTRCRQANVPLKDEKGRLKAMVFLMDDFHVEPFLLMKGVDFEETKC